MTPRRSQPTTGAKGEKAQASAVKKVAKGKPPKGKSELPGVTIRRGRQEGA